LVRNASAKMSGVVDSGRESGHGNIDTNDREQTLGLLWPTASGL
jgi:hypothetical protein